MKINYMIRIPIGYISMMLYRWYVLESCKL
jgi:hypothetical protein